MSTPARSTVPMVATFCAMAAFSANCHPPSGDGAAGYASPQQGDQGGIPFVPTGELQPVRNISDGKDDEQLQRAMQMAGAMRYWIVDDSNAAAKTETAPGTEVVGVVTRKGHYRLEVRRDSLVARFRHISRGEPGSAGVRGWSNATDDRTRLTGGSVPIEQGQVTVSFGKCSGSLIGRRIVRTAAHCVVFHNTSGGAPTASVTYDARRDGASVYATDTTGFYFYGGAYMSSGCATTMGSDYSWGYRTNLDACTWADWAYLILDTNWYSEAGWITWYGYMGLTSGNLGMDLTSGGYPNCDDTWVFNGQVWVHAENSVVIDPANCLINPNSHYRDETSVCEVGQWTASPAKFKTGCDGSVSASGGPVLQRGTSYLVGHLQFDDCLTCNASTNYPNRYLGHDDWLFNLQNQLRNDYP
jgi:hypothetical protein